MEEMWVEQVRQPREHGYRDYENSPDLQQSQSLNPRDPLGNT